MVCVYVLVAALFVELGPALKPWRRLIFHAYWPYMLGYTSAVFINLWALFYWLGRKIGRCSVSSRNGTLIENSVWAPDEHHRRCSRTE